MDFKKHTQERYKQRFLRELSDSDYEKMCEMCKNGNTLFEKISPKKERRRSHKMIILFNDIYTWVVVSKRKKIIKTVYPMRAKDLKLLTPVLAVEGSDLKPNSSGGILP